MISLMSVCLPVSLHASARLPLKEFPRNLILENATKIRRGGGGGGLKIEAARSIEISIRIDGFKLKQYKQYTYNVTLWCVRVMFMPPRLF